MPRLLYAFALCNLVIGTGAFIIGGILGPISGSLHVSVATAGQAMTGYALSTAALAPLMLVLTGRWRRKRALCFGMAVFALGNTLCALAPDFATLVAGRILMGVGAMFTPIAAGIAVALVEPERRGRALSPWSRCSRSPACWRSPSCCRATSPPPARRSRACRSCCRSRRCCGRCR